MAEEQHSTYLFTSESVTEGHPDKICDQISDAILDAILEKETELQKQGYISPSGQPADVSKVRCACETMTTTGMVVVAGEIRTQAYVDVPTIVRNVICEIGYDRAKYGFDGTTCGVLNAIHEQSPDIAQGVDESFEAQHGEAEDVYETVGAGDQGMMFGYACKETKTLMPMPIYLAQRMSERLAKVRKDGTLPYLRPDGKTQVSVRYVDGAPVNVEKVVVSTQHAEDIDNATLRRDVTEQVIKPVLADEGVELAEGAEIHINPTGRFVIGGPMGDCGLTGRKIIVDTYGGMGRHGGGAFSGRTARRLTAPLLTPLVGLRRTWWLPTWPTVARSGCLRYRRREASLHHGRDLRYGTRSRGRHRACGERGLRPASGRHHRRPRPASPHLSQDGRLWSLRPRASRVHLGKNRSR